ncbi:MAG: hypothetical protein R2755_28125 [Acidimicrobiales bacterium]
MGNGTAIDVPSNSDIAYVRFTADNADTATAGAEAVASETLITLTNSTLIAARAASIRPTPPRPRLIAVDAITAPFGVVDLQREYDQVDAQVKDLEKQIATVKTRPIRRSPTSPTCSISGATSGRSWPGALPENTSAPTSACRR